MPLGHASNEKNEYTFTEEMDYDSLMIYRHTENVARRLADRREAIVEAARALAAAGLPPEQRTRAILIGIVGATILRILLAGLTTQITADRWSTFRGRHSAFVGVLENLARAAVELHCRAGNPGQLGHQP